MFKLFGHISLRATLCRIGSESHLVEFKYQHLPNATIGSADILILPVPLEATVSFKAGTASAPQAILAATEQLEYYEEDQAWSPMQYLTVAVHPPLHQRTEENPTAFHSRLNQLCASLPKNNLLLALGGEHAITPSIVQGRLTEPGTVVFLDAHADLRPQFHGSAFSHACPAYRLRQLHCKMVMIGIRSLCAQEAMAIAQDADIVLFSDRQLRHLQARNSMLKTLNTLQGPVWLSIDMDVFDPSLAPGVGTPQPGGLDWYMAIDILEALILNSSVQLVGADIVELVPEPSHVSAMVAAKLLQKIISFWGKAQRFDRRATVGSQTLVTTQ